MSWMAGAIPVLAAGVIGALGLRLALRLRLSLARRRWALAGEDVVVLHQIARPGLGTEKAALSISGRRQ